MKRIALIFLVPFNVWAGTPQIFFGAIDGGLNTASTTTGQILGLSGYGYGTTLARGDGILAVPGTFSNFKQCINIAPGVGKSFAFTVQLGTRRTDSPITCTIADTNTCCSDVTHSSSTVAGDFITVKAVPSGTPTANTSASASIIFTPSVENNYVTVTNQTGISGTSTCFPPPTGAVGARTLDTDTRVPLSPPGTFDQLYAAVDTAPGAGKSWTITFRTNGASSSITCTISGTATGCSDLTHSSATIRGDVLNYMIVASGAPASTTFQIGLRFRPTNRGEFPVFGNTFNGMSNVTDNFVAVSGGNMGNTTEATKVSTTTSPSPGFILKNGTYAVTTAPGGAASFTYTMRKNFVAPTGGPTATISATATTAQDNNYMVFTDTDNLTAKWAPSGTPTAGQFHAGFTGYFTQPQIITSFP